MKKLFVLSNPFEKPSSQVCVYSYPCLTLSICVSVLLYVKAVDYMKLIRTVLLSDTCCKVFPETSISLM